MEVWALMKQLARMYDVTSHNFTSTICKILYQKELLYSFESNADFLSTRVQYYNI